MSRLVWLLLMLACGPAPTSPPPPPAAAAVPALEAATALPPPAAPEPAHALSFRVADAAATPRDMPGLGQLIVADRAEVSLDLEDGTRVTLAPQTRVLALAFAPSLLLISGQLHVVRLPDAAHAGTVAARIATLAGALEVGPGTEATLGAIATAKPGKKLSELRAQLQLLRGAATWLSLDPGSPVREAQLTAGATPTSIAGLHWLAPGAASFDASFRKLPAMMLAPAEDAERVLDRALSEQQALRDRGHELLASVSPHHAALAKLAREGSSTKDSVVPAASTREYQRALVEQAQRSHAHAAQLLLAAERSLLQALLGCGERVEGSCASARAWAERFSTRCASLL